MTTRWQDHHSLLWVAVAPHRPERFHHSSIRLHRWTHRQSLDSLGDLRLRCWLTGDQLPFRLVLLSFSWFKNTKITEKDENFFSFWWTFFMWKCLTWIPATQWLPSSMGRGVAVELVFMRVYAVRQANRAGPGAVSGWYSAVYAFCLCHTLA